MVRLTDVGRFCRTHPRLFKLWPPKLTDSDASNWRIRLAVIYAVSAWTMIGSVAYMHWRADDKPKTGAETGEDREQNGEDDFQDPTQDPDKKKRFTFTVTTVHKENFVPYTTRIWQYFKPSDNSSTAK